MSNEITLVIDGKSVDFVRKDSIPSCSAPIAGKRIIVGDCGWVFVGDCIDLEGGKVEIRNARNIRRWGTTKGLGELADGPTSLTKHDDYGTVVLVPVVSIGVRGGW